MIFWDTSALIRCYEANERSHARAKNLLLHEKGHIGSALIRIEAFSGIRRRLGNDKGNLRSLLTTIEEHLDHFDLSPIDERVLEKGINLVDRHALRAGDAIQLAAAVLLSKDLGRRQMRFATVDAEQAKAASSEGLKVIRLD
jgi:predicted nucleic acid-binding protein